MGSNTVCNPIRLRNLLFETTDQFSIIEFNSWFWCGNSAGFFYNYTKMSRHERSLFTPAKSSNQSDYPVRPLQDMFDNLRPQNQSRMKTRKMNAHRYREALEFYKSRDNNEPSLISKSQETSKPQFEQSTILHMTRSKSKQIPIPAEDIESAKLNQRQPDAKSESSNPKLQGQDEQSEHQSECNERQQEDKQGENSRNQLNDQDLQIDQKAQATNEKLKKETQNQNSVGLVFEVKVARQVPQKSEPIDQHNMKTQRTLKKQKKIAKQPKRSKKQSKGEGQDSLSNKVFTTISAVFN